MISFEYGREIQDREFYARLLRDIWGPYGPADVEMFERRIQNAGNGIIAVRFDDKPAAILETMRMPVVDVRDMGDFNQLTRNGTWASYNPNGSMLVLVDMTVHPDMEGKGIVKELVKKQLPNYLGKVSSIRTYSPLTAQALHERYKARKLDIIPGGRADYPKSPDVVVMEYPIEVVSSWVNGNGHANGNGSNVNGNGFHS